jgi:beta-lactam-binding protein with PASTA domain
VQSETAGPSEFSVSGTQEPAAGTPAPTVEFAEGEGILVPAFEGKAVREVTEECTKLGLNPVLVGTGIAIEQSPGAGATIRRGSHITVQFARGVLASSAAHRRGDR